MLSSPAIWSWLFSANAATELDVTGADLPRNCFPTASSTMVLISLGSECAVGGSRRIDAFKSLTAPITSANWAAGAKSR